MGACLVPWVGGSPLTYLSFFLLCGVMLPSTLTYLTPQNLSLLNCNMSPRESVEYVFTGVGLCVCLSVTTITKTIVDGFYQMFPYGEREDQVRVWLRSVAGCGSNGKKNSVNRRLFTFYTSNNRCGKSCQVLATKNPNFAFAGSCTRIIFHLVTL